MQHLRSKLGCWIFGTRRLFLHYNLLTCPKRIGGIYLFGFPFARKLPAGDRLSFPGECVVFMQRPSTEQARRVKLPCATWVEIAAGG